MKGISGGTRKIGRNKIACAKYTNAHMCEKNKIRKWRKMIKKLSDNNKTCIELKKRIKELEKVII